MSKLSHIDADGKANMVDIGSKPETRRVASASARVRLSLEAFTAVVSGGAAKGDVLAVSRLAGISAAKQVPALIPLCHHVPLDYIDIDFEPVPDGPEILIRSKAAATWKTGVEMEAITAVAIAAVTIYDMCKSLDRSISITQIRLERKSGGKSGVYSRTETEKQGEKRSR